MTPAVNIASRRAPASAPPAPLPEADRMSQLDGLRALAFIGVAVSHWAPAFLAGIVPWGTGVQLFFVLSGFLITRILLQNRPAEGGFALGAILRAFYARRFLRIFPLYYGVLALALIFSVGPIRDAWPWHVGYVSNFLYAWHGHDSAVVDPFLHFWSLGVEEQFYLAWPLLVLALPPRALPAVLYGAIGGALLFRVGIGHVVPGIVSVRYLTPSCLDGFGVGALIAHAEQVGGIPAMRRLALKLAVAGFVGVAASTLVLAHFIGGTDARSVGHTFLVIFYGALVAGAACGLRWLPGRLLTFAPLSYLGKISYGLYVYHYFAPYAAAAVVARWGVPSLGEPPFALLFYAVFTVAAAALSWHAYESPLNRLKKWFPYPGARAAGRVPAAAAATLLPSPETVRSRVAP